MHISPVKICLLKKIYEYDQYVVRARFHSIALIKHELGYLWIDLREHTTRARVESFYLRHTDGADTLIKLANICKIPILCYLW